MAKAAHILVSVMFGVSAIGLWALLTSAKSAFIWHYGNDVALHSYASFWIHNRNCLFLIPVSAGIWSALQCRRPSISMESSFLYFLSAATFTLGLFVMVGVSLIYARMLIVF
jgi:hypothetical protein